MDDFELFKLLNGGRTEPIRLARLPALCIALMAVRSDKVILSKETALKQKFKHPEIGLIDYKNIEYALHHGSIYSDRPRNLSIVFRDPNNQNRHLKCVIKSANRGGEEFFKTFHQINKKSLGQYRKRHIPVRLSLESNP